MNKPQSDWIQTYTGRQFWPLEPRPGDVCIEDIAHSLANQCRFAGHSSQFYSVAQHCCLMYATAPGWLRPQALMHDAAEAYITDIPRPLKGMLKINDIERQVEHAISKRFGFQWPFSPELHDLDNRMLATEKRDLMVYGNSWTSIEGLEPFHLPVVPWSPFTAEVMFLKLFSDLCELGSLTR